MKFIQFLNTHKDFSGEIIATKKYGFETEFSFEWGKDGRFTAFGRKYFKPILQSEIEFHSNGVIVLLNDEITYELFHKFMAWTAGYVAVTFDEKVYKRVKK